MRVGSLWVPKGVGNIKPRTEKAMGVSWVKRLLSRNKMVSSGDSVEGEVKNASLRRKGERERAREKPVTRTPPHSSHIKVFVCVCVCVCSKKKGWGWREIDFVNFYVVYSLFIWPIN